MQGVWFVLILSVSLLLTSECADCNGWLSFNGNEICFQLFRFNPLMNFTAASDFCATQSAIAFNPGLAAIKNTRLQEFLTNALFGNEDVFDGIWLGSRFNENRQRFEWTEDGSPLSNYNNWAPGYPRDVDDTDRCVEMRAPNSKSSESVAAGAQWYDVSCRKNNLVLCQRQPVWSLEELVGEVIELRKAALPVGFIYTEYPGSPSPQTIWPALIWQDISAQHSGNFFRVVGGEAAGWSEVQSPCAPRITIADFSTDHGGGNVPLPVNGWSGLVRSGSWNGWAHDQQTVRFYTEGCEVRPRNTAIRIWKRIA